MGQNNEFISESKLTKRNLTNFAKAYGDVNLSEIKLIFERFERRSDNLRNKDIFTYGSLHKLKSALQPTVKEINAVSNSRKVNENGVMELRSDKLPQIYNLLRCTYGYDLMDEDLCDVAKGFSDMTACDVATQNIFNFSSIHTLKAAIQDHRNSGDVARIDEDPEVNGSEKIYSDENIIVYKVKNYEDSKTLCHGCGKKASWCISYESGVNYWNDYSKKGVEFIFVLMRDGDKYAIATKGDGEDIEVYNTADTMVSGFHIVNKHPEIVDAIRKAGYPKFKSAEDYEIKKTKEGWTEVQEVYAGLLGGGARVEVVSRIDEYGEYLDEDIHGTWGMKIVR